MRTNLPEDLWKRVDKGSPEECWPWRGYTRPNGYGIISVNGVGVSTHRLAFLLAVGSIPERLFVCHHCDNPPCCNPAHLYAGTPAENSRDCVARNRHPSRKGSLSPVAKLTEHCVREIRRRRSSGERGVDLAREFGVSPPTITRVVKREGWVHV